jgi:hypothetical protein
VYLLSSSVETAIPTGLWHSLSLPFISAISCYSF